MAVPSISGLTQIDGCEALTNYSGWGIDATKWVVDSDFELEGTNCIGLTPKNTGDGGYGYLHGTNIDLSATGNRLFFWVFVAGKDWVSTATTYGVYIRITDSATSWTTNYNDYIVGGSDVAWVGAGWHLVALDCTRTPDRTAGTAPVLTAIRQVGLGKNMTQTSLKSTIIAMDNIMIGTQVEVTGVTSSSANHVFNDNGAGADTITRAAGDFTTDGFEDGDTIRVDGTVSNDGEYTVTTAAATTLTLQTGILTAEASVACYVDAAITLESIYQKDGPTDDSWMGAVSKNRDGGYEINYTMILGDEAGALRTFFISRGEQIVFTDQPLSETTTQLQIKSAEDTGNTIIVFGKSTGTGDDRVGYAGSIVSQDTTFFADSTDGPALAKIDLSATIATCEFFGCTVLSVNDGILFANDTSHYVTNCAFDACGQVDTYNVECRNLTLSQYAGLDGAIIWRNGGITESQFKQSRFLTNTRAIEHDTADAGEQYSDLTFSGNTYDIHFSATTGDLVINATGTSNPSGARVENDSTGTVTVNNTKTLSVACKNQAGLTVPGVRVRIENLSTGVLIANGTTDSLGVYEDSTYNYGGDVNVKIIARLKGYKNNSAQDTIKSTGLSVPFTMLRDPSVNLP